MNAADCRLQTHNLSTQDITLMSNLSSTTVVGQRISKLKTSQVNEEASTIHLGFEVKSSQETDDEMLGKTTDLEFILDTDDALELGMLLVAMSMSHQSQEESAITFDRLSNLMKEFC